MYFQTRKDKSFSDNFFIIAFHWASKNYFKKVRKKVDAHRNVQVHFCVVGRKSAGATLCSHKCGIIYTRFHASIQRSRRFLCGCVIAYLLCETSVEHPTSFVEASQKRRNSKS